MNRTLSPGGCLNIAYGVIDPSAGPMSFTIATTPQVLQPPRNGNGSAIPLDYRVSDAFTLLHIWTTEPVFTSTKSLLSTPCSIPYYNSTYDAVLSPVVEPDSFPQTLVIQSDSTYIYSAEFTYITGCPFPSGNKPLNYYVQVWGQSHTKKENGAWKILPQPGLSFSAEGLTIDVNNMGVGNVTKAATDKSRVGKAEACPGTKDTKAAGTASASGALQTVLSGASLVALSLIL
ncbi:hypothetical protein BCR33DRAFT_713794 [Rhizoclosmatium globosum]|uniref:Uncharacterized protein n=1 Tax=Rhizoclosmatium globosum TaxID=329046 RepID=A0A1Y2CSZ2_9FUNG|nr:hypothetical protein BCR33DRAFT_713794 [Rhizoclosmatium globosum]|eukprot:ORY49485.1 hypothetical protein BCR33DRAFT_713794 [Rhizoclosmatium globosum]